MKALGLVFSARAGGNCYDLTSYCLQQLKEKGIEINIIDCSKLKILPCSNCNYECFSGRIRGTEERCLIEDDILEIYEEFERADMVIFGIPTYVGHVPAIFRAWEERGLGIYGLDELYQKLEKKTYGFIVIGSHSVLDETMRRFYGNPKIAWILLRSREYGLDPLKKGLIEVSDVRNRLDTFMQTLMRLATQKNH